MNDSEALHTLRTWVRQGTRLVNDCVSGRKILREASGDRAEVIVRLPAMKPFHCYASVLPDGVQLTIYDKQFVDTTLGGAVEAARPEVEDVFERLRKDVAKYKRIIEALREE